MAPIILPCCQAFQALTVSDKVALCRLFANMSSNQAGVYRGGNTTGTTGTGTATGGATELRNTTGTAGTGVVSAERGEPICDQKYYTKVGQPIT